MVVVTACDAPGGWGEDVIQHWQIHLTLFSRKGFTTDAQRYLKISDVLGVDLKRLDTDLRERQLAGRHLFLSIGTKPAGPVGMLCRRLLLLKPFHRDQRQVQISDPRQQAVQGGLIHHPARHERVTRLGLVQCQAGEPLRAAIRQMAFHTNLVNARVIHGRATRGAVVIGHTQPIDASCRSL